MQRITVGWSERPNVTVKTIEKWNYKFAIATSKFFWHLKILPVSNQAFLDFADNITMSGTANDEQLGRQSDGRREDSRCSFGIMKWDPSYVRYEWGGRLKVAEALGTFLAGVILPSTIYRHGSVFTFFDFVVWTSFINVLIDLFLHLFSIWGHIMYICRAPEVYVALCSVASFSFLLSSALLAGFSNYSSDPTRAGVSAFFGFICACLFGVEAFFIHFLAYRQGRGQTVRQDEADEFVEPI